MTRALRIAFIVPDARPTNSHGRYVLALAAAFAPMHEVHIFTGRKAQRSLASVQYHLLPMMQRPSVARLASLWAQSMIWVQPHRFDIVHAQAADAPVGNVVTAHYCHSAKVDRLPETELYAKLNRMIGKWAERFVYRRMPLTIAVSHLMRTDLMQYYALPRERIRVVHHGVDTVAFEMPHQQRQRREVREQLGFSETDFVLVFVGGEYLRKGLLQVLEALGKLGATIKLLVLGCREDGYLAQKLDQHQLRDRVVLTGPVENVVPYYAASDCFVLPTLYDTFGLVVLEAMAAGLPVIVSAAAGASELITDGENGFILPTPDDVDGLVQRIQSLVCNRELASTVGQLAYRQAQAQSWDVAAQHTLQVYQELVPQPVNV